MASPARSRRGRWRRVGIRLLVLVAIVALVLPVLALLGLRTPAVRGAILTRVADAVEGRTGVRLSARDFRLDLRGGVVEIEELVLTVHDRGEGSPFLTVPRARAVIRWRTLFGDHPFIESLSFENPRLDLRAPLPAFEDESDAGDAHAGDSAVPAIEILELGLVGGEILGPPASDEMDVWLDAWRAEGIRLRGAYRSGRIGVEEASARLIVDSHRRETLELAIDASISGDLATGAFTVDSLGIVGNGLTLGASGHFEIATATGGLAFDLDFEPAHVFPDLTSSGRARGKGELQLTRSPDPVVGGVLRIDATDIPAELASPWLEGVDVRGPLDPSGTRIDIDADLDVAIAMERDEGSDPGDRVVGSADLLWRRGAEPLLMATVRSLDPGDGTASGRGGVHVAFTAELTPTAPGQRRVSGELHAPAWIDLLDGTLRSTRIDLNEPDLEGSVQRFGFDPSALPAWWPEGGVTASLEADGPVTAPRMRLDARWNRGAEILAAVSARTLDGEAAPSLHVQYRATLLPEAPGRRELSGELLAPGWDRIAEGEIRDGRLAVDLHDLAGAHAELRRRLPKLIPEELVSGELHAVLLRGRVSARLDVTGPVLGPDLHVDAEWMPTDGESISLVARGRPSADPPFVGPGGTAELTVRNLSLAPLSSVTTAESAEPGGIGGRIDGVLRLETSTEGGTASLRLDGNDLSYGELVSLDGLRIEATTDGEVIDLRRFSGRLRAGPPESSYGGEFSGSGRFDLAWPLGQAEVRVAIEQPIEGIDGIETMLVLGDGTLRLERTNISQSGKDAWIQATIPLGALDGIVDEMDAFVVAPAAGPISVEVTNVDLAMLASLLDSDGVLPPMHGILDGSFTFDPQNPVASAGWLTVSRGGVEVQGETVEVGSTVRIEMQDAKIVFPRTLLQPTGGLVRGSVPLELSAVAELSPSWQPGDDLAALLERFAVDLAGTVDASLLNPFLAGGAASGEVSLMIDATGSMDDLHANVRIRGPDASVIYRRPYATRLEALEVDLTARGSEVVLERASARLNGGDAEMTGMFSPDDGLKADLHFDGAHYRLQFGIATRLSGDVQIEWPLDGRRRLAGNLVLERAVLRRPIRLNRETLGVLLDVERQAGANNSLDTIDLDLNVLTEEGVLIKNNVADLHADWGRLHITGTAADPLLEGRVDVRAGGIVTFLGLVYRIDEASLEWFGEPPAEPRWVMEWTSHLDDPTIVQSWRNEFFTPAELGPGRGGTLDFRGQAWAGAGAGGEGGFQTLAAGAATQATSAGRTQLSFEPLPLFGETDTQARYTISQDLSPQLSFIASTNPREAEAQTYIVDVHQLPGFPSFRAQVFTNDRKNAGLTIQQTLKLGARPETDPLLRSTTIEAPEGVRKRRLRRAIGFRKRDPFPEGAGLDVEVDVSDALRRKGYASADVTVDLERTERNRVDVHVTVDPGTRVSFVFEGDKLPKSYRRTIKSAYRPSELGENASLEEVQRETAQSLYGLGYLDPRVGVDSAPLEPTEPDGPRLIRVVADGGRRAGLSELVFEGVPEEEAQRLTEIFGSTRARVELVLESPAADGVLVGALQDRGYPAPGIAGRSLSEDGDTLVVRIEPGDRRRLASVEIEGLTEEDRARLAEQLEARPGDPVRTDRIGQDARAIERDLRGRGHADARVRAQLKPVDADRPLEIVLRFDVDPGPSYRIEDVRFEGLEASRPGWVAGAAGLEPGGVYRQSDVAEARGRLYRTGVFRRIRVTTEKEEEGQLAALKFDLQESRRWRLAYGGRWEESQGLSGVVDLLNQNSLGRGQLTGVRGIYGAKEQNLRLYHVIPRIVGERSSLELYLEGGREELTSNITVSGAEAWAQLTFPLTRRIHSRPYIRFNDPDLTNENPDPSLGLDQRVISPLIGWQLAFDALSRGIGELRREGIFIGVDFLGSHESLGSDVTSIGLISQLQYFWPLGKSDGRFTWAQFWRGGWTEARGEPVPFVDRYRLGGEFSVRGYPTNSLGPVINGVPLGGEVLFIVNQELHADLFRTQSAGAVSALVFFDAGNTWLNRGAVDAELFKSIGIGARYISPFGPLRLDVGFPLDRRPGDPGSKIYFGFGSVF